MAARKSPPNRIHLIAHANPAGKDVRRYGFASTEAYLDFIRQHLPAPLRLTASLRLLKATEDQQRGGRRDDAARIRDVQDALDDPATLAIVAAAGGAYFSRLLPHFDFSALDQRKTPLWTLGFSEMTNFVNLVAARRGGRGLYWLCPNYLGWKISPRKKALAAFGEFWRTLPRVLADEQIDDAEQLAFGPIEAKLVSGQAKSGRTRIVGGCLSLLAVAPGSAVSRKTAPAGKWLVLEDVNEQPYRVDRMLASLKLAGWFERVAGILIGSFRQDGEEQAAAVREMLRYHLPADRNVPIAVTSQVGHIWPMRPVAINHPLRLEVSGKKLRFVC